MFTKRNNESVLAKMLKEKISPMAIYVTNHCNMASV